MSIWRPVAMVVRGPYTGQERWTDIRVLSSDMKQLWRSLHEVSGRTKFDWPVLRKIHEDLQANNPAMSQNELIDELQGTYRDRFNKEPPGRTTIQSKMKTWL